jgi:hypothetical protein
MIRISRLFAAARRDLRTRWPAVALLAAALAYADEFWVSVIQSLVGAIEYNEPPFTRWLRDTTLSLPLVSIGVLAALLLAQRWQLWRRHGLAAFTVTTLLVAVLSGAIGIGAVAMSSLQSYLLQRQHLELLHSFGVNQSSVAALADFSPAGNATYNLYCSLRGVAASDAVSLLEYATLLLHIRALAYAALLVLMTNLVIAGTMLVLLRSRLRPRVAELSISVGDSDDQLRMATYPT